MAEIDQTEIHLEDLESDKPFFSGELQQDEHKIGKCIYDINDIVTSVEKEKIAQIITRLQNASGLDEVKTCITQYITTIFGLSGLFTGLLRDGVAKKNNGFKYNEEGLTKENNVFYISKINKNENNTISDRSKWLRGIINNDILAQRFNLWNVSMIGGNIFLNSTDDFKNYRFEEGQLVNGLKISFIATEDGVGYAVNEGYRIIIDGNIEKKFFESKQDEAIISSKIKAGQLVNIYYNSSADNGNGAFFLEDIQYNEQLISNGNIGVINWFDVLKDEELPNDEYIKLNGQMIYLNNYPLFKQYIQKMLLTHPSQFIDYDDWNNLRTQYGQINKYVYESQRLYAYKHEHSEVIIYTMTDYSDLENDKIITVNTYRQDRTFIDKKIATKYGVWRNYYTMIEPKDLKITTDYYGFIYSNFLDTLNSNYLKINNKIPANLNDWSVIFSFITGNSISGEQVIFLGNYIHENGLYGIKVYLHNERLFFSFVDNNNQEFLLTDKEVASNERYNIRIIATQENYKIYVNDIQLNSQTRTSNIRYVDNNSCYCVFGKNPYTLQYFEGKVLIYDYFTYIGQWYLLEKFKRDEEDDINKTLPLYGWNCEIDGQNQVLYTKNNSLPSGKEFQKIALYNSSNKVVVKNALCNQNGIWPNVNNMIRYTLYNPENGTLEFTNAVRYFNKNRQHFFSFDICIGFKTNDINIYNEQTYTTILSIVDDIKHKSFHESLFAIDYSCVNNNHRFEFVLPYVGSKRIDLENNKKYYVRVKRNPGSKLCQIFLKKEGEEYEEIFSGNASEYQDQQCNNISINTDKISKRVIFFLDEEYYVDVYNNNQLINLDSFVKATRNQEEDKIITNDDVYLHLKDIKDVTGNNDNIIDNTGLNQMNVGQSEPRQVLKASGQYGIKIK